MVNQILVLNFSDIWSFRLYGQLYQDKTMDHISETQCIMIPLFTGSGSGSRMGKRLKIRLRTQKHNTFIISSVRISNLGWHFFPSKVAPGNPYLSCLLKDLSKIFVDFLPRFKSKVYHISDKSVHREMRKSVSEATFDGNKRQPKLQIRTLIIRYTEEGEWETLPTTLTTARYRHTALMVDAC